MLHGITEQKQDSFWDPLRPHLPSSQFDQAVRLLTKYYTFISLSEAVAMLEGKKQIQPYCAVLTFDDGYRNNATIALPVLQKFGVPVSFFVPTAHIETGRRFWYDRLDYALQFTQEERVVLRLGEELYPIDTTTRESLRKTYIDFLRNYNLVGVNDFEVKNDIEGVLKFLEEGFSEDLIANFEKDDFVEIMSWDDVEEVARHGVSVGSHSSDHIKLRTVDSETIQKQLNRSKKDIENHLGGVCEFICYPNGNFDDRVVRAAKQSGYRAGLTTVRGVNKVGDDLFSLRRIPLPVYSSKAKVFASIYGLFEYGSKIRKAKCNFVERLKNKIPLVSSPNNCSETCGLISHKSVSGDCLKPEADKTGHRNMLKNIVFGWGAQFIFLVAGFVLPRMLNDSIGQEALGVWDFAWSLIAYFTLVQAGVVSSVNRYVAKYYTADDNNNVNVSVSSVTLLLVVMAIIILLLSGSAYFLIPQYLGSKLGQYVVDAQKVVFWLGTGLAVQVSLAAYGGVLAGCHRWDIHHGINATARLSTFLGMLVVLFSGGGLAELAIVYFCCETLVYGTRIIFAHRIYPELQVKMSLVSWGRAKEMLLFGGKTFLPVLGEVLGNQTISILIIWFIGPAALAVYARPRALVRHVQTFMFRYAFVLSPTVSSMQEMDDFEGIKNLLIRASRYGAYIFMPIILFLAIMGGSLLRIWMGENYEHQILLSVLALGYLPFILQLPMTSILRGLNLHGRAGAVESAASVLGICGVWIVLGPMNGSMVNAVIAAVVPSFLIEAIVIPFYARLVLGISLLHYFREVFFKPLLMLAPYIISLVFVKINFAGRPVDSLILGMLIGLLSLMLPYWMYVIPASLKEKVKNLLVANG